MSELATTEPMLPPSEDPSESPHRRRGPLSGRRHALIVAVLVLVLVVIGFFTVPAQWVGRLLPGDSVIDDGAVALKPGSAIDTAPRISVADLAVFVPDGSVLFTTVVVDDQVSLADWVFGSLRDSVRFLPREQVFGGRSADEERELNLEMMQTAKNTAVVAAIEYLGVDAVTETGVAFGEVPEGGPADGLLEPGEVIVSIDDQPVTTLESLLDRLAERPSGTEIDLGVVGHDGALRQQSMTLGVHPDGSSSGFIGIAAVVERVEDVPLPFTLDIDSGSIGGPSAGLAFSLAIIDLLTDGELTGGGRIAVTGTITGDGMVGPVGGVAQKARAAEQAGATLFIVPVANLADAREGAKEMEVAGVATLEEALAELARRGGETEGLRLDR